MEEADIDIYLDIKDPKLQIATAGNNHRDIVQHIEKGLSVSTHLLCLISSETRFSWWVPYEIGYAKKAGKNISSLKLSKTKDIPSFLNIEKFHNNIAGFKSYLEQILNPNLDEILPNSLKSDLERKILNKDVLEKHLSDIIDSN